MYLILIVIQCHVPSCPINYTVNESYHYVDTTRGAMGTFAISSLRFYFVRKGFGFRTEISDANRLLLLCRSLLLLLRWECTWCCWRGLWLTRHVFGIESYDLRATVYVLLLVFWRVGLLRETNLRYNRANPPASGRGWWMLHGFMWFHGWPRRCVENWGKMIWKADIYTWLGDDGRHCPLYSEAMRGGLQSEG